MIDWLIDLLIALATIIAALVTVTRIGAFLIARRYPPVGAFATVDGTRLHFVHKPASAGADLVPVLIIHGASSNLLDMMRALEPSLRDRAELLFVDRPGHGWSERGTGHRHDTPAGQARTIAALMDRLGMERAVIVGHSFGAATAATIAVNHPEKAVGLICLSAATHPWPGGKTSWYNTLAEKPFVGRLFVETLTLPAGLSRLSSAMRCVFSPNRMPSDYGQQAAIPLVLRPRNFRFNAIDCAKLYDYVCAMAPRYREIAAPTVIITGNRDTVVFEEIHSLGLARDIPHAQFVVVDNLGHKPDWIATDLVVGAIEAVNGKPVDLKALARAVEVRIAGDRHSGCVEPQLGNPELALPLTQ